MSSQECGGGNEWAVHFGSKAGNYLIVTLLVEVWTSLGLYFLTLRRHAENETYTEERQMWLFNQVREDLAEDENEELLWNGFPERALAFQDALHWRMGCFWLTPSGVPIFAPTLEALMHMLIFAAAHSLAFVFVFVWRGSYGECPWPYAVIITLFASVVLCMVVLPFALEKLFRKPLPLVIYAVTTHRAMAIRAQWMTSTEEDDEQEVTSFHLRRKTGNVWVNGFHVLFTVAKDSTEVALEFMLLADAEEVFDLVCRAQNQAMSLLPLSPRSPTCSGSLRTLGAGTAAEEIAAAGPLSQPRSEQPDLATQLLDAVDKARAGESVWAKPGGAWRIDREQLLHEQQEQQHPLEMRPRHMSWS